MISPIGAKKARTGALFLNELRFVIAPAYVGRVCEKSTSRKFAGRTFLRIAVRCPAARGGGRRRKNAAENALYAQNAHRKRAHTLPARGGAGHVPVPMAGQSVHAGRTDRRLLGAGHPAHPLFRRHAAARLPYGHPQNARRARELEGAPCLPARARCRRQQFARRGARAGRGSRYRQCGRNCRLCAAVHRCGAV